MNIHYFKQKTEYDEPIRDRSSAVCSSDINRDESALYVRLMEILPSARGPLILDACLRMAYTTVLIGGLGILGLGLPPPDPDWGGMVKDTYSMMSTYPHMSLIPCAAISSLVVGFNLLADGLREISQRD